MSGQQNKDVDPREQGREFRRDRFITEAEGVVPLGQIKRSEERELPDDDSKEKGE